MTFHRRVSSVSSVSSASTTTCVSVIHTKNENDEDREELRETPTTPKNNNRPDALNSDGVIGSNARFERFSLYRPKTVKARSRADRAGKHAMHQRSLSFNGHMPFSSRLNHGGLKQAFDELSIHKPKLLSSTFSKLAHANSQGSHVKGDYCASFSSPSSPHHLRFRKNKDLLSLEIPSLHKSISTSRSFLRTRGKENIGLFGPSIPKLSTPKASSVVPIGPSAIKLGKTRASIDSKGLTTFVNFDESWSCIETQVLSVYKGEELHVPIEDLNGIVVVHIRNCIQESNLGTFIEEIEELFQKGAYVLAATLSSETDSVFYARFMESWLFFTTHVSPFLEAIFLPIQSQLLDPHENSTLSYEVREFCSLNKTRLNVRRKALLAFRDYVFIPLKDRLLSVIHETLNGRTSVTTWVSSMLCKTLQVPCYILGLGVQDENNHTVKRFFEEIYTLADQFQAQSKRQ